MLARADKYARGSITRAIDQSYHVPALSREPRRAYIRSVAPRVHNLSPGFFFSRYSWWSRIQIWFLARARKSVYLMCYRCCKQWCVSFVRLRTNVLLHFVPKSIRIERGQSGDLVCIVGVKVKTSLFTRSGHNNKIESAVACRCFALPDYIMKISDIVRYSQRIVINPADR